MHDFLKPRSHILVETAQDIYSNWLQPLVDAPASRYHLRDWDDRTSAVPEQYIKDGLIRADLGKDNYTNDRNDSLLVIGNWSRSRRKGHRSLSESQLKIHRLVDDIRYKKGFQAHGPVRYLLWLSDADKHSLIPKSVSYRTKISLAIEMTCHAEEIAGEGEVSRHQERRREEALEIESGMRVVKEMERTNIQIALDRQDQRQKRIREYATNLAGSVALGTSTSTTNSSGMTFNKYRTWHKEMENIETDLREGKISKYSNAPLETDEQLHTQPKHGSQKALSPEFHRLVELQRHFKHDKKNRAILDSLFREQEAVDSLELKLLCTGLDPLERERQLKEFTRRNEFVQAQLTQTNRKVQIQFSHDYDDKRALDQDPPILMWDKRKAEPLAAKMDEAYPPSRVALLDFQPKSSALSTLTSEQGVLYDLLSSTLFINSSQTLYVLNNLAAGAFDAVVSRVPALQDMRKGGRRDLSRLKVHSLTPEMMIEITLAWDKWAQKPSIAEMCSEAMIRGRIE